MCHSSSYFVQQKQNSSVFTKKEIKQISESIGHILSNNYQEYFPYYDLEVIINTLRKIENGEIKLKSLEESYSLLFDSRYKIIDKESKENKIAAEKAIEEISKNSKFKEIISKKLYYEIVRTGEGPFLDENSTPLIHFSETYLNNRIVRGTKPSEPFRIKLSETIAGFKEGVQGMRVGEKRKIYAHPDLTYGTVARQQLSIFDVEIVSE